MTGIDSALWEKIEIDEGRKFPAGLRTEINEIIDSFSRRGTPDTVCKDGMIGAIWNDHKRKFDHMSNLVSDIYDAISSLPSSMHNKIFADTDGGVCEKHTKRQLEILSGLIANGAKKHKKSKSHGQKRLNATFLKIIIEHIDDAYSRHYRNIELTRSWNAGIESSTLGKVWKYATPPWVFEVIRRTDRSAAYAESAIDKALVEHIKRRRAGASPKIDVHEGDVFRWGCRFLVVAEIFDDAAGCDVCEEISGPRVGYEEIEFTELAMLESILQFADHR